MKMGKDSAGDPNTTWKQSIPPVQKRMEFGLSDGIIARMARECGGNVHDRHVVDITSGSFGKETKATNPPSGVFGYDPQYAAKNAADLETDSYFWSDCRSSPDFILRTRNNWGCCNFNERRIVPIYSTIRSY
jgi:hypothetical protein